MTRLHGAGVTNRARRLVAQKYERKVKAHEKKKAALLAKLVKEREDMDEGYVLERSPVQVGDVLLTNLGVPFAKVSSLCVLGGEILVYACFASWKRRAPSAKKSAKDSGDWKVRWSTTQTYIDRVMPKDTKDTKDTKGKK